MRYIILHNIRSAYNVGAIFRTADGVGVTKIFICGYTPAPVDRFGRVVAEIQKTSLGASDHVPWEYHSTPVDVIEQLKQANVQIVAVEQTPRSSGLFSTAFTEQVAFIFGNEITGVDETILQIADVFVEVPMYGHKESLNVSVCAGVVLYEHVRQFWGT
jgi:tRNA G18 (ribose-2'-O)-methylase SpoU